MTLTESKDHPFVFEQNVFDPFPNVGPFLSLEYQRFEEIRTNCKYYSSDNINEIKDTDQDLSIIHINARSLLSDSKFEDLKTMLFRTGKNWDIICISETWLQSDIGHSRQLSGYTSFFDNRCGQTGGGVAIYIKSIKIKAASRLKVHLVCTQSLFVEIDLYNSFSFIVGQVYRPPNLDSAVFVEELSNCIESISAMKKTVLISGDFNFDLFSIVQNISVQEFFNTFSSFGFLPLISKTTRACGQSLSLLDNIYCNDLSLIKDSGLLIDDTSDHFPVFSHLDIKTTDRIDKPVFISRFDFRRLPELREHLRNTLADFQHIADPELASAALVKAYQSGIQKFSIQHKVSRKESPLKPWITPAILSSINVRCKLYIRKQKYPTEINKRKYNRYRNILNSVIRSAKKTYIQNQLEINKGNSKKMWEILLTHTKGLKGQSPLPDTVHANGAEITDHSEIAKKFNSYFSTVGKILQEQIPESPNNPLEFVTNSEINIDTLEPISEVELIAIVSSMQNVGGGMDGINAKIFKATYEIITKELTHFINLCLRLGKFPSNLKIAVIKPIYKSGEKFYVSNYRPISILPFISKILEKIIYKRLMTHLETNSILSPNQFGFRKKLSTYMPLLLLQEKITKAFENSKIVCGLYLDLKKAFDTVDHNILLSKIYSYGVTGIFFNIIKSYLTHRMQCVEYKGTKSAATEVSIGVPQGSILGPLLFIIYVNDFSRICTNSTCLLYADDTAIFFEARSEEELQNRIDTEIPKIVNWFNSNKLSINASKTYCQMYNNTENIINIKARIGDTDIEFTDCIKYLGMYIDKDLKWRSHINHISNILSRNAGIIKKSSFFLERKQLLLLYNSLFLPYINYCCLVWGHSAPTLLDRLNKIQKKVIRVISKQHRLAHTNPIFENLKILKIKDIAVQQSVILMHNVISQNLPPAIYSMFTLSNDNVNIRTRMNRHFEEPFTAKLYATRTISWLGPRLWNKIIATSFPNIEMVPASKAGIKRISKDKIIATYSDE